MVMVRSACGARRDWDGLLSPDGRQGKRTPVPTFAYDCGRMPCRSIALIFHTINVPARSLASLFVEKAFARDVSGLSNLIVQVFTSWPMEEFPTASVQIGKGKHFNKRAHTT